MTLVTWSWLFMILYIGAMLAIGILGQRRVKHADDFATARGSYGPVFLAFAFAATTASGATFLGGPGLAYSYGFATVWGNFLYPIGVYFGVLISMRLIATSGNRFGNRSIPEYLGDRYQADGIRVIVSIFSLVLFFYLAGQLVSGLVMFEVMLGMPPIWALIVTSTVLGIYVAFGGAHADILTDGAQGVMMLVLAIVVIALFVLGVGVDGGLSGLVDNLGKQDEHLVKPLNVTTPLYHSWWSIGCVVLAHLPLGLLPHLGNKLWALKGTDQQRSFIKLAFTFGITLGMLGPRRFAGARRAARRTAAGRCDAERVPADALHRAVPHLARGADRRRDFGRNHVHGGRVGRLLVADHRQRPLPADARQAPDPEQDRGGAGPHRTDDRPRSPRWPPW